MDTAFKKLKRRISTMKADSLSALMDIELCADVSNLREMSLRVGGRRDYLLAEADHCNSSK